MTARGTGRVALFLSARSLLRGNWGILTTTISMMVLIYLNLLFLPSLIQGASNHVVERLVDTVTSNVVVSPASDTTSIANAQAYTSEIAAQPGVAAVTAVKLVGNRIFSNSAGGSWSVYAADPTTYNRVFTTHHSLIEGSWLAPSDTGGIVLGAGIAGAGKRQLPNYASSLQTVHVGDSVTVMLANGQPHQFRVKGIFDDQFQLADAKAYITDAAMAKLLPGAQDSADTVYIKTAGDANPRSVSNEIKPLASHVKIQNSTELEGVIHDQTASFDLINNILKVVSALVAAITIFIVTYIDLVNRRRQIGIERAIGIRGGAIVISYCLKAIAYTVVGIAAGALLFKAAVVPFVAHHPFQFPNGPVTLSPSASELRRDALILIVVAISAAFIPAWRSVRIRILDAIWG